MSAPITSYGSLVEQLPEDSTLTLRNVSWKEYEELLEAVGTAMHLRISYDEGTLQIMTISSQHESYADLIQNFVRLYTLRLGMKLRSFGSATMKKASESKGSEPDTCFYVQNAEIIGNRKEIDFATDPPPDVVVEVDIQHDSRSKFPIYAALRVPELWRYDGQALNIYQLRESDYLPCPASLALPLLTPELLGGFLARTQKEDENAVLLAFEEWLKASQQQV
ncbi:MAG: Uma2 family endonuclease [Acidobacteria bacterium]|nr:Uma2 family endonuclease [Acidobacteriota bacterium]MCI0720667.1 Uma2 family endonuclease [Acidobacteriota bacterium]